MNVGVALLGGVGGAGIAIALAVRDRRDRALDARLAAEGRAATATVVDVTATGRHLSMRRVTFAVDDGQFMQTFPFVEFGELGVTVGTQVRVRVMSDPHTGHLLGRLVPPASVVPTRAGVVPITIGVFIAVLGVLASLVV